jgi:hypothetical protein
MKHPISLSLLALGTVCFAADEPLKPVEIPAGKAGELNREALEAFKRGDLKKAQQLIDQSSVQALADPRPWVNGALINLEMGKMGQASRALQQAQLMGDRSQRRITLKVELETSRGQLGKAWKQVDLGEFYESEDAYLHTARAKWAEAAGEPRVQERSRWQAFRSGTAPLLDSKLYNASSISGSGGATSAGRGRAFLRQVSSSVAGVASLEAATQTIGGRSQARQTGWQADVAASIPKIGAVMFQWDRAIHDRPGALPGAFASLQTPGAQLDRRHFLIGVQPKFGNFTFNANFREIEARVKGSTSAPLVRDALTRQWMLEGRYDQGPFTLGAGMSEVQRRGAANAYESLEDRFGPDGTRLSHAYAVHRWNPDRNIRLISGAVLTQVDGKSNLLLTAELAVRIFADQFLRIGMEPTMNRTGTVLFPEDLRGRRLVRYPNTGPWNSIGGNSALALFTPTGKSHTTYASIPLTQTTTGSASLRLFQTQFSNARFASGNPELQLSQAYVPVARGTITGATLSTSMSFGTALELGLEATLQSNRANGQDVPLVPRSQVSLTADYSVKDWMASASLDFVGPRTIATFDGPAQGKSIRADGRWVLNFGLSYPVGGGILKLEALNVGRTSLFPGYGASSLFQLTYSSRF